MIGRGDLLKLRMKTGKRLWSWRYLLSSKSALKSAEKISIAFQSLDQSIYERINFIPTSGMKSIEKSV